MPDDDGSCRGPYSALFASGLGEKVSCGFKGSASLRVHCRSPTQPAFHKVGVSSSPMVRAILIIFSFRSALNVISKSVMIYLHENDMPCKALAIDLCCRGFSIWQHYVDSMEMLRSLFSLATSTKKESISAQNVGPQARQAVLHIVTTDTGIFMTTLSLDILHPHSLEHRKSVMQLVAFLIRKVGFFFFSCTELIFSDSLSISLSETTCHTSQSSKTNGSGGEVPGPQFHGAPRRRPGRCDGNSRACREDVRAWLSSLDAQFYLTASVRSFSLRSFPTIDFHMATQRLAVGTGEGAIVMYDLKTATRLYVLECHRRGLTACSFSPDGRRLVTVSLEEGAVFVWKVGSSFTSFFHPGAPPSQGHGGSEPFKSLNFNVGDAGVCFFPLHYF